MGAHLSARLESTIENSRNVEDTSINEAVTTVVLRKAPKRDPKVTIADIWIQGQRSKHCPPRIQQSSRINRFQSDGAGTGGIGTGAGVGGVGAGAGVGTGHLLPLRTITACSPGSERFPAAEHLNPHFPS
jgi:hypothetical protein